MPYRQCQRLLIMIRRAAMRQPCVQVNVFQINDAVQNIREGLYTRWVERGDKGHVI
jgi:hypothetical protein